MADNINPAYAPMLDRLAQHFSEQGSVLLQQFLTDDGFDRVCKAVNEAEFIASCDPLHHRFSVAQVPQVIVDMLPEILRFSRSICGKELHIDSARLFRLTWRDYQLLSEEEAGVDVIIDFTADWDEQSGGNVVYKRDDGEIITFPAGINSLVLVRRDNDMQKFFQYVNHYGEEKERLFFLATLR